MVFVILILWIAIYPVDSAIQLLNNWGQVKIASHFIGVSRASFNLAGGASIKPVAFGQWESRNYFSFFSRPFLDIFLVLVFSRGESIAREHTTPLVTARDTENKYGGTRLFLCKF